MGNVVCRHPIVSFCRNVVQARPETIRGLGLYLDLRCPEFIREYSYPGIVRAVRRTSTRPASALNDLKGAISC